MKKAVSIILAILVVATSVVLYINGKKTQEYNAKSMEISNQLLSCNSDKAAIEAKIDQAWGEYDEILSGGACCLTLFVDNITPNLMNEAYPLIKTYGYSATAVMDNFSIPGEEGCISKNDYDKLKREGWDFAIGTMSVDLSGENHIEVLDKYIEDYSAKLTENGFDVPRTICFGRGQYTEDYVDTILKHNFKVVRHYETFDGMFSHGVERNGLYILTTANICSGSTTLKKDMGTAYSELYTYSATVRYITEADQEEDKYKDCAKSKYVNMLRFMESDCPDAQVLNATELYNYKTNVLSESEDFLKVFNEKIDKLQAELDKVEADIDGLMTELAQLDK